MELTNEQGTGAFKITVHNPRHERGVRQATEDLHADPANGTHYGHAGVTFGGRQGNHWHFRCNGCQDTIFVPAARWAR